MYPTTAATTNEWRDPRTLVAVGGVLIGLFGFLFGVVTHRWARRESRLEALGKVLRPLVRAAQSLFKANSARKKAEQLKHSYPNSGELPEVVHHVNRLISEF